jgi:hypothetical protein
VLVHSARPPEDLGRQLLGAVHRVPAARQLQPLRVAPLGAPARGRGRRQEAGGCGPGRRQRRRRQRRRRRRLSRSLLPLHVSIFLA